jgi:hypothetical protein
MNPPVGVRVELAPITETLAVAVANANSFIRK